MPRLWIAAITTVAALAVMPAVAQATVTTSTISAWTSSEPGTPENSPYLISLDNTPTTVRVTGTTNGTAGDLVDIVCFYGSPSKLVRLRGGVAVGSGGGFDTGDVPLRAIAGHACRLRAIPAGGGAEDDTSSYAGRRIAVSEADLPVALASGPNAGTPYNFYVNAVTFTGFATWSAVGTPSKSLSTISPYACGGPNAAPVDAAFNVANNFAIDCAGSLLSDDLGVWGGRSEIQVDGRNAYDPAAAADLFPNLGGLPKTLTASVRFDPTSGLLSSSSNEPFVLCNGPNAEIPTSSTCPSFVDSGVKLQRTVTTSDSGRVMTVTDTWSSSDGAAHTVDLLYDDVVGVAGFGDGNRGWQFPGQTGFSQYVGGNSVPAPAAAPGSILMRTNVSAADGDPSEAFGAITFGTAPTGFRFASNSELEEHHVLVVPPGGGVSLTYVYSIGYTSAEVGALALAGQDRLQPLALAITSVANSSTGSTGAAVLTGTAAAGSGISSLVVAGQSVPVGSGGAWSAKVPLRAGPNVITALATDGAGATASAQVTVVYQVPASSPPAATCKVPRTKGLKLANAQKALRRAHCRVGRIKRVRSRKVRRGRVLSTSPRAGRKLRGGAKVELFVSKGG